MGGKWQISDGKCGPLESAPYHQRRPKFQVVNGSDQSSDQRRCRKQSREERVIKTTAAKRMTQELTWDKPSCSFIFQINWKVTLRCRRMTFQLHNHKSPKIRSNSKRYNVLLFSDGKMGWDDYFTVTILSCEDIAQYCKVIWHFNRPQSNVH